MVLFTWPPPLVRAPGAGDPGLWWVYTPTWGYGIVIRVTTARSCPSRSDPQRLRRRTARLSRMGAFGFDRERLTEHLVRAGFANTCDGWVDPGRGLRDLSLWCLEPRGVSLEVSGSIGRDWGSDDSGVWCHG
jgi:hypothetical protein